MQPRRPMSYEKIRKDAQRALSQAGVRSAPVDVEAIAQSLGAHVRYSPFEGELAGMLMRSEGNTVIGVNSVDPKNRQRFTIAHECGHLLLHKAEFHVDRRLHVNRRDEKSSMATDPDEIEANRFAAELLMPFELMKADLVGRMIDVEDDNQIRELAEKYGVSAQAMTLRVTYMLNLSGSL